MSRTTKIQGALRLGGYALLGTLALACAKDKPKPLIDRIAEASECGLGVDGGVSLQGELQGLSLLAECGDGDPCEPETAYVQGSAVLVGVELHELRSELFFADLLTPERKEVTNVSVLRDPCSEKPKMLAIVFLDDAGEQTLELSDDEGVIEHFTLFAQPAERVQVAIENEAGELEPVDMLELTSEAVTLRATPSDASGEVLNVLNQAVWWIEDTSVAAFGAAETTNSEGVVAELSPVAEGDSTLHVLIANVEQLIPVHVAAE